MTVERSPLKEFVALFNQGHYWASHEILEAAWRSDRSEFFHGLILYASAWVHQQRENPHGVASQFAKAEAALGPFLPVHLGLDVAEILRHRPGRDRPPELHLTAR